MGNAGILLTGFIGGCIAAFIADKVIDKVQMYLKEKKYFKNN